MAFIKILFFEALHWVLHAREREMHFLKEDIFEPRYQSKASYIFDAEIVNNSYFLCYGAKAPSFYFQQEGTR